MVTNGQKAEQTGINIVPFFERRLGFLESEIVQRDIQIEMMAQEIARLTAQVQPEVPIPHE